MTPQENKSPENRRDAPNSVWQALIAAAKGAPAEASPESSGDLASRVLNVRSHLIAKVHTAEEPRIVSYAAAFALAASLLFMLSSWGAVTEVVSPSPAVFEDLVAWESLP